VKVKVREKCEEDEFEVRERLRTYFQNMINALARISRDARIPQDLSVVKDFRLTPDQDGRLGVTVWVYLDPQWIKKNRPGEGDIIVVRFDKKDLT
jgi:hypothetical protein